jgi:hypothetical protein
MHYGNRIHRYKMNVSTRLSVNVEALLALFVNGSPQGLGYNKCPPKGSSWYLFTMSLVEDSTKLIKKRNT